MFWRAWFRAAPPPVHAAPPVSAAPSLVIPARADPDVLNAVSVSALERARRNLADAMRRVKSMESTDRDTMMRMSDEDVLLLREALVDVRDDRSRWIREYRRLRETERPARLAAADSIDARLDSWPLPLASVFAAKTDARAADHSYSSGDLDRIEGKVQCIINNMRMAAVLGKKRCQTEFGYDDQEYALLRYVLERKGYRCEHMRHGSLQVSWDHVGASATADLTALRGEVDALKDSVTRLWYAPGMPGAVEAENDFAAASERDLATVTSGRDE